MTTDEILTTSVMAVEMPRGAIAHVIGSWGQSLETQLEVNIRFMDGEGGTAVVSLMGPRSDWPSLPCG